MITASVKGRNFALVLKGIETLDARVLDAGARGLGRGLLMAVGVVQKDFLQGPRPQKLGEVTTRLRQSIISGVEMLPGRGVVGRVGTNVIYGAYHEFGFSGFRKLKPHAVVQGPRKGKRIEYKGRPFVRPGVEKAMPLILSEVTRAIQEATRG